MAEFGTYDENVTFYETENSDSIHRSKPSTFMTKNSVSFLILISSTTQTSFSNVNINSNSVTYEIQNTNVIVNFSNERIQLKTFYVNALIGKGSEPNKRAHHEMIAPIMTFQIDTSGRPKKKLTKKRSHNH